MKESFILLCVPTFLFLYLCLQDLWAFPVHQLPVEQHIPEPEVTTTTLVIARTRFENVEWATSLSGPDFWTAAVYTVDDITENPLPANKGHEAMVYLTHVITQYNNLSDVNLFMHAHQFSWHNNDLLDMDSRRMVQQISKPRISREGYMNMRCHLEPGCPAHLFLTDQTEDGNFPEIMYMKQAWMEMFPGEEIPTSLAQACCAQFAVTRERIQKRSLEQYTQIRDWLLHAPLDDKVSGRVFEYVWQYLFTGQYEVCPSEHVCYCDGYGCCFENDDHYVEYIAIKLDKDKINDELEVIDRIDERRRLGMEGNDEEEKEDDTTKEYRGLLEHDEDEAATFKNYLREKRDEFEEMLKERREAAFERGKDPRHRAFVAGRSWKEGDGY